MLTEVYPVVKLGSEDTCLEYNYLRIYVKPNKKFAKCNLQSSKWWHHLKNTH